MGQGIDNIKYALPRGRLWGGHLTICNLLLSS